MEPMKPCPFCGKDPVANISDDEFPYQIACIDGDCPGWHDVWEYTKEEALKKWNTRKGAE